MVDLDYDIFQQNIEKIMYVGSSRARYKLFLVANIDNDECETILENKNVKKSKKPEKAFAASYNAKYKEV